MFENVAFIRYGPLSGCSGQLVDPFPLSCKICPWLFHMSVQGRVAAVSVCQYCFRAVIQCPTQKEKENQSPVTISILRLLLVTLFVICHTMRSTGRSNHFYQSFQAR